MKRLPTGKTVLVITIALLGVMALLMFNLPGNEDIPVQSQGDIKLAIRAGYNRYCKEGGKWLPVWVNVENTGNDLDAVVEVTFNNNGRTATYRKSILLPHASQNEVLFHVYPKSFHTLTARLVSGGTILAATNITVDCFENDDFVVGLVTDNPIGLDNTSMLHPARGRVFMPNLGLADLPERAEGLGTLNVLVFSGVDTGRLNQSQRDALEGWLARGGTMLIIGGPHGQPVNNGLGHLSPVEIDGTTEVADLSALVDYIQAGQPLEGKATLSVGRLREGANVLAQQDGIPILAEQRIGFGRVIHLAADPSIQPLNTWEGMDELYDLLLSPRASVPPWVSHDQWDEFYQRQALSSIAGLEPPSLLSFLIWMGVYVAVIGPIHYFMLKRRRRQSMAWITIPALACLFTTAAYLIGSAYRGNDIILNRLALVQAWDGQEQAQVMALVGIYSPSRATYTLQSEDLLFAPLEVNSLGLGLHSDWTIIQEGLTHQVSDIRVESAGMKSFAAQGHMQALPIHHTLRIDVRSENPTLTGRITNDSPYTLRNVVLFAHGSYRHLGNLAPGKSIAVSFLHIPNSGRSYFADTTAARLLQATEPLDMDTLRKTFLLDATMHPAPSGYFLPASTKANWGIYLMGWLDVPTLDIELDGEQAQTVDTTLYVQSLSPSVHFGKGPWKITTNLMIWESSDVSISPYRNDLFNPPTFTLWFRPAIPVPFKTVNALILHLYVHRNAQPANDASVQLWNYSTGTWQEVKNLVPGRNFIPNPSQFVSRHGEIRLKQKKDGAIVFSYFTLLVSP
ncbi:MAG: hypothetical protein HY869_13640 [Chloroflexi bacterium]|nr:hypothetical protein [Chloroflexota bacterium]